MTTAGRQSRVPSIFLIGLPIIANVISFVVFAPLFTPGREPTDADYVHASNSLGIALILLELVAVGLIAWLRSKQGQTLFSFRLDRLRDYLVTGLIALVPTLAAGWLYVRGQVAAGVETDPARLNLGGIVLWYAMIPVAAAGLEETIWRGYAFPLLARRWQRYIFTALSFALFHGIFSPLVLLATLIQGLIWGWVYERTESTVPSMVLHLLSRYLVFIPGFG